MSKSGKRPNVDFELRRQHLMKCSEEAAKSGPGAHQVLSAHLTRLLVGVAKKSKGKLGSENKIRICQGCGVLNVIGKNVKIKVKKGRIIYTCQLCFTSKQRLIKEKKAKNGQK